PVRRRAQVQIFDPSRFGGWGRETIPREWNSEELRVRSRWQARGAGDGYANARSVLEDVGQGGAGVSPIVPAAKGNLNVVTIDGREVRVTHPDKPYFTKETKLSKIELVRYYLSVAPGALFGIRDRPIVLKRFVHGAEGEAFYQKRAPSDTPDWMRTITLSFPS